MSGTLSKERFNKAVTSRKPKKYNKSKLSLEKVNLINSSCENLSIKHFMTVFQWHSLQKHFQECWRIFTEVKITFFCSSLDTVSHGKYEHVKIGRLRLYLFRGNNGIH